MDEPSLALMVLSETDLRKVIRIPKGTLSVNNYTYDSANRLTTVSGQSSTVNYAYNGLGDRYQQTVNSQTTTYVLDLNAGLTQVLDDGTNTYTYGLGRISQTNVTTEYFLTDALGSVRQLTNTTADITSAQAYSPYGTNLSSAGDSETPYGFTGEITDPTGNIYLRARYYNPNDGRFINRDTFPGYSTLSQSQNRFIYVENNPIRYTDPTGHHYSLDDFINEAQSLINDPVQHTLDQIQKNRNLPWECTDVGQIVQWAAPALAPLIIVAAIPMLLVSPDSAIDFASMIYDHHTGDYQAFYLDAMALMIPGVTGLGMLSKADDAYDALRFSDDIFTPSMGHSDYYADAINIKIPGLPDGNWTFVGYHGTTTTHLDSILAGINPPKPGMNWGGSQLGDGFYTTKNFSTARMFSNDAIRVELKNLIEKYGVTEAMNMAPSSVIFEVYAKDFNKMHGSTVLEEFGWWEDFQPELWQKYDYLQAPISGYPSKMQIKFDPSAYNNLIAILNR